MLGIQEYTRETIVHRTTVEHCITTFNGSVKTLHYWINCINCCQNICNNLKKLKFYLTSCGCIYCAECLERESGSCYIHGKITHFQPLILLPNSSEVALENVELGKKYNNLFMNNRKKAFELHKTIQYANASYDISVKRLDQLLEESEQEKERALAKLNALERDKEKLDKDIEKLKSVIRLKEKNKINELYKCHRNRLESYQLRRPLNYKYVNNFALDRQNQDDYKMSCNKKKSQDSKLIKYYWNTITEKNVDEPDIARCDPVLISSKGNFGPIPSTGNFKDFQSIRNPAHENRNDKLAKIDYKSGIGKGGKINTAVKDATVDSNKRLIQSKSGNPPEQAPYHKKGFLNNTKIGEPNCIIHTKPINKYRILPEIMLNTCNPNTTVNDLQTRRSADYNYMKSVDEIDYKLDGKIQTSAMDLKGEDANINLTSKQIGNVHVEEEEMDYSKGTKRNILSNGDISGLSYENNCFDTVQNLISKVKSEINKIKSVDVANQKESQQSVNTGEITEINKGSVRSPGNFETVWISENIDGIDDLANSFDSDIFNLRS